MITNQYPYVDKSGTEQYGLVKHESDQKKYILQNETGAKYAEAIDVYPSRYTYSETEEDIPEEETISIPEEESGIPEEETQSLT